MGKNKLKKFLQNKTFAHVIEPNPLSLLEENHPLRGRWQQDFFKNELPLVLELGCGKGEYTVNLAEKYPEYNYIGMDIKGARIWSGAKIVAEKKINNVAFVRSKIQFIERFFAPEEVAQIWITFADPQPKKAEKRLTADRFLNHYKNILIPQGKIHLKTDSDLLFDFTLEQIQKNRLHLEEKLIDLEKLKPQLSEEKKALMGIQTHYEKLFAPIHTIKYLSFHL